MYLGMCRLIFCRNKGYLFLQRLECLTVCLGTWLVSPLFFSNQGRSQPFQKWGGIRGVQGVDWDSKWQLSIDPCSKCLFILGGGLKEGPGLLTGNALASG